MAREFSYFRARVRATRQLSPHLLRIVVGGDDIARWRSSGVPDEAMLVVLPEEGTEQITMPVEVRDGDPYARSRWYTVRDVDPVRNEVTFDVVLHDVGLATAWARTVAVGDAVGISSTHHWYSPPDEARWQVLAGDLVAVPAFARIIEQAPAHVRTHAYVEVPGVGDEQPELGDAVTWVHNTQLGLDGSRLAEIVRDIELPRGPGYVYVAGEAAATRAVRKYLRHEIGMAKGTYVAVGYWRVRSEEWMSRFRSSGVDLERVYADGEQAGLDAEQLTDEVDRQLEDAGL